MKTSEVLKSWKPEMNAIPGCNITMEESSTTSMMMTSADSYEVILQSTQYEELKQVSDQIVTELTARPDVTEVHSSLENASPLVKIDVDPVKAAAEGLAPVQIAGVINQMISGVEATTMEVNGEEVSVKVEYAPDEYRTLDQLENIVLTNPMGASVALTDVAEIGFKDSPLSITRTNKQYQVTITGDYTEHASTDRAKAKSILDREVLTPKPDQQRFCGTKQRG